MVQQGPPDSEAFERLAAELLAGIMITMSVDPQRGYTDEEMEDVDESPEEVEKIKQKAQMSMRLQEDLFFTVLERWFQDRVDYKRVRTLANQIARTRIDEVFSRLGVQVDHGELAWVSGAPQDYTQMRNNLIAVTKEGIH